MKMLNYETDRAAINKIIEQRRDFYIDEEVKQTVSEIVSRVKEQGDRALHEYTARFDGVKLEDFRVSQKELTRAQNRVGDSFIRSLRLSIKNVRQFHEKQLVNSWFDSSRERMVGQQVTPLQRIGAYVPGGTAAYPSSLVMAVVPARAAGVEEVVVTTPPDEEGGVNPYILAAAAEAGVDEIYKAGGAQAVAALAFGTELIKPVDKIVGPGNIYVTAAKKMVYGTVDIDMLAGPSELLVLADDSGNPDYIAADLLSQAEHDTRAAVVLVTTSRDLARDVQKLLKEQLAELSRREIAVESLEKYGFIITVDDLRTGIKVVNDFAPEHFELVVREPFASLGLIKNAGAIFVGSNTSEPLGDYIAGPNHVLPTGGTARFSSPLNTGDFLKRSSVIYYGEESIQREGEDVERLARLEGLDAHARAVAIRRKSN